MQLSRAWSRGGRMILRCLPVFSFQQSAFPPSTGRRPLSNNPANTHKGRQRVIFHPGKRTACSPFVPYVRLLMKPNRQLRDVFYFFIFLFLLHSGFTWTSPQSSWPPRGCCGNAPSKQATLPPVGVWIPATGKVSNATMQRYRNRR